MKICYLSSILTIHDARILQKLLDHEYDTTLVSYSPEEIPGKISTIEGLKILHFKSSRLISYQKFLFFAKRNHFRKVLQTLNPDILHSGYVWKDGFLAALSGFSPHLLMPWGTDVLLQPDQSLLCRLIVQYTLRKADAIYCDAETVKKKILRLASVGENKIIVFPQLGVDFSLFKPDQTLRALYRKRLELGNSKVIIMTREFKVVYGIEYFIRALPKIVKAEPSIRVLLAGQGPQENQLKKLITGLNLENYVRFLGFIKNEELPGYLNAADIYVSTSLSDGTPLSLLEAMSCGLPVVVSDVESVLEWVQDGVNGFVVPRKDTEILPEKTLKIAYDSLLAQKMGKRNIELAQEKVDIEKNFQKLATVYSKMINGQLGSPI